NNIRNTHLWLSRNKHMHMIPIMHLAVNNWQSWFSAIVLSTSSSLTSTEPTKTLRRYLAAQIRW
ncbi:hypothetical protein, partial [Candidatus Bathycorpusculum sp.]|uniref:hypothetical protein n=1 Tax=Candidatus Bathycorpusculum sp. TaxID=2994959 RepID=UPI00282E5BBC|nr:hypothetical protein [Candidatus Termitimicrobium sp.]